MHYTTGTTPHGRVLMLWNERGLVALRMLVKITETAALEELREKYPQAECTRDKANGELWLQRLNDVLNGKKSAASIEIDWQGTAFQNRVWKELAKVPFGETCSYSDLAKKIGRPKAVRAVANACARNPIGLLVPCHRVVRSDGGLGGFYWGVDCKRKILDFEKSNRA